MTFGRSGPQADLAHRRAQSGGGAYAVSAKRWAPLRRILREQADRYTYVEVLECHHVQRVRQDMIGDTYAMRRRCLECLEAACTAFGHPVAPNEWYESRGRCRCGKRDDLRDRKR